jgi:GTPase
LRTGSGTCLRKPTAGRSRPSIGRNGLSGRRWSGRACRGEDDSLAHADFADAIAIDWAWHDRPIRLVDTAGLRRRPRVEGKLEELSVGDALRAIRFAETVILVLDALQPFERQDLTIARLVADEGRALVVAATKWDAVAQGAAVLQRLRERASISLPQLSGVALVPVSGLTGLGLDAMMRAVCAAGEVWNRRVSTAHLNRWLAAVQERHPPPLIAGRRLRLRYMTQVNTRPPTFALFASKPGELPASYRRYLVNALRQKFSLPGTPIRMMLRKGKNPYDGR